MSVSDVFQQAIWIILISSMPVLLVAMVVGLVIGILQTATSIQEQTLVFIPKILAVFLLLFLLGPWMFGHVGEFAKYLFGNLASLVP
ncbi:MULTISPECIES: flagellar biosynthesis protein FliQ [Acetomicrobium]|nr:MULTISPECIES: flagellar biosynthesis protein FliQ [Acetomicrobium]